MAFGGPGERPSGEDSGDVFVKDGVALTPGTPYSSAGALGDRIHIFAVDDTHWDILVSSSGWAE